MKPKEKFDQVVNTAKSYVLASFYGNIKRNGDGGIDLTDVNNISLQMAWETLPEELLIDINETDWTNIFEGKLFCEGDHYITALFKKIKEFDDFHQWYIYEVEYAEVIYLGPYPDQEN